MRCIFRPHSGIVIRHATTASITILDLKFTCISSQTVANIVCPHFSALFVA